MPSGSIGDLGVNACRADQCGRRVGSAVARLRREATRRPSVLVADTVDRVAGRPDSVPPRSALRPATTYLYSVNRAHGHEWAGLPCGAESARPAHRQGQSASEVFREPRCRPALIVSGLLDFCGKATGLILLNRWDRSDPEAAGYFPTQIATRSARLVTPAFCDAR